MESESESGPESESKLKSKSFLDPKGYSPVFQIIIAFSIGVIASPFSNGLLFLLIVAFILELINAYRTDADYCHENTLLRGGLFLYSFFGFIVGRSFCCGDWDPLRGDYKNDPDAKKKRFEEHNQKCIEGQECGWCNH